MKRFLMLMMAIALLTAVLCGCGTSNGGTPADSTPAATDMEPSAPPVSTPPATTEPKDDGKVTYTVTVLDQNDNPVEGVSIQFCDEENCKMPVLTDANGTVTEKYKASEYHITLAELPAGYTSEETVFYFGDSTELTIVITAE